MSPVLAGTLTVRRPKHRRRPILDPKMEAVLARLVAESPNGVLAKTQAVKLPYLVDVVATHALGQPITSGRYSPWAHGVVATEVYDLITSARYGGEPLEGTPFAVEEPMGFEDRQTLVLQGDVPDLLTEEEAEVVDFVAIQFGGLDASRLGRLTKQMNSHVKTWPSPGKAVRLNEPAYEVLPVGFDEVDAEIALERLRAIEKDPDRLISGAELDKELAEILR